MSIYLQQLRISPKYDGQPADIVVVDMFSEGGRQKRMNEKFWKMKRT